MKPGETYTLKCFAKMHDADYFMIVHDDFDCMNSYIISFANFDDLKTAFLEQIKEHPDAFDDPCVGPCPQGKGYYYAAHIGDSNRIEIDIGNLTKKQIREISDTLRLDGASI